MFFVVVSSKNTSEFGHLWVSGCVWEWGNTIVKWLMMVCVTKLTGRYFVLFSLWKWWISTITAICVFYFLVSVWVYIVWRHFFTRSAITVWCVCLSVSEPTKHVPVCFFSSPKGLSGFRFHLFKKFVSIVFPFLQLSIVFFLIIIS